MNKHINKKGILVAALGALIGLSACVKDLDRRPTNITTSENILSSGESTKQALAKVYGAFALTGNEGPAGQGDVAGIDEGFSDFFRNFFNLQELCTDEAICTWSDDGLPDLHNLNWSSSNPFVKGLYYRSLYQIKLAVNFLELTESKASDPTIKQYRAEARFLRAFQYWIMMDLFGNPPMIDQQLGTGKVFPKQIQRADLFKHIESELKEIENDLAAPRTNEYGRADKATAWALLSRIYLNAEVYTGTERYADAAEYAERVILSGYKLAEQYASLFRADNNVNNPETILAIGYDGINSKNWGGATFLVNGSTNADIQKTLGVNMGVDGGWGGNRATSALVAQFEGADKEDSRYLMDHRELNIQKVSDIMQGVWITKFRNVKSDGSAAKHNTFVDTDFPLFRLAEMYLNYAEASVRGKADASKGLEYFNRLRQRAYGNSNGAMRSISLDILLKERARELYWECLRRTDLIRFGKFTSGEYLWPWKGGIAEGRGVEDHYKLYPLPADDVQSNRNLKQNPKY